MKLIPKDAVLAVIDKVMAEEMKLYKTACKEGDEEISSSPMVYTMMRMLRASINSLEVKEVDEVPKISFPHYKDIVDKVFGAGNLESWEYEDAEQLVLLAKDEVISQACEAAGMKKPYKDGNQWCFLYGDNIQEGICGFGDKIEDAFVDFLRNVPKISLEVKEVDLEKELNEYGYHYDYVSLADRKELMDFAKHFFELGLKVNKEENI